MNCEGFHEETTKSVRVPVAQRCQPANLVTLHGGCIGANSGCRHHTNGAFDFYQLKNVTTGGEKVDYMRTHDRQCLEELGVLSEAEEKKHRSRR